tara:strand:+ start:620 stop:868 length:249 start_codon:yes stop_codon:yes gene_type:complete
VYDKIEKILETGEKILNNANKGKERESILNVLELDSLSSFFLGMSIVLYVVESNGNLKDIDNITSKTIVIMNNNKKKNILYN